MMTIKINERELQAEENQTVLEVALAAGIKIPTLCYHKELSPYGACRVCLVEIVAGGRPGIQTACLYRCTEGLEVKTDTERVQKARKVVLELLLARSPESKKVQAMAAEYGILGLSTGDHVMALYRERLREQGILSSGELEACRQGERVTVAGLVVVHQAPPTAKGMRFITLEDEEGLMNIVVRPDVYQEHRHTLIHSPLLVIEGVVQRRGAVVNVQAVGASARAGGWSDPPPLPRWPVPRR